MQIEGLRRLPDRQFPKERRYKYEMKIASLFCFLIRLFIFQEIVFDNMLFEFGLMASLKL
jgi:hypothetical protein